jgi:hypothetical protein
MRLKKLDWLTALMTQLSQDLRDTLAPVLDDYTPKRPK